MPDADLEIMGGGGGGGGGEGGRSSRPLDKVREGFLAKTFFGPSGLSLVQT